MRSDRWLWATLVFAAATRAGAFFYARATDPLFGYLLHDALRYDRWARAILTGETFEPGAFSQAPLYPNFVALVYRLSRPEPWTVYAVQLALGLVLIGLLYRVAGRAYGRTAARAAAMLGALYGIFPFYETKLLPGSLTALAALLVAERLQASRRSERAIVSSLAGLAVGVGSLLGAGLLLVAPPALFWLTTDRTRPVRGRVVRGLWFSFAVAVVIVPVTLRNAGTGGGLVPVSSNGGITFYQGNHEGARGLFDTPPGFGGSIFDQREESRRLAEREAGRPLTDAEVSAHWFRKGGRWLADHPGRAAGLVLRKLGFALAQYDAPLEYNASLDPDPMRRVLFLPFAALVGLAAVRPFRRERGSPAEGAVGWVLASQVAVLLIFYVSGRYRLPMTALLLVVAGGGLATLVDRLRRGVRGAVIPAIVALVVASASAGYVGWAEPRVPAAQRALGLCDLALAEARTGDVERGIALYRQALALAPGYAAGWLDLGLLQLERGDLTGAGASFERALAIDPRYEAAASNLLGVKLTLGRYDEARDLLATMRGRGLEPAPGVRSLLERHGLSPR